MKLTEISRAEASRYMGVRGEPDAAVTALLDRFEPVVRERMRPAYVYRELRTEEREEGIVLPDVGLTLTGEDVRRHLSGCGRVVMLAATLSAEADKLIRQSQVEGMAEAMAVDALCSAAIEQVCDRAEEEIFSAIDAPYRTWRFSPGYGDLPIGSQRDFLNALNAQRRIGLTVTASCLLIPSKSVTALIGISDTVLENKGKKGCAGCDLRESCAFSKLGGCGKK